MNILELDLPKLISLDYGNITSNNIVNALVHKRRREINKFEFKVKLLERETQRNTQAIEKSKISFLYNINHKRREWWRLDKHTRDAIRKDFEETTLKINKNKPPPLVQETNILKLPELNDNRDYYFVERKPKRLPPLESRLNSIIDSSTWVDDEAPYLGETRKDKLPQLQTTETAVSLGPIKKENSFVNANGAEGSRKTPSLTLFKSFQPSLSNLSSEALKNKTIKTVDAFNENTAVESGEFSNRITKSFYSNSNSNLKYGNLKLRKSNLRLVPIANHYRGDYFNKTLNRFLKKSPFYVESKLTIGKIESENKSLKNQASKHRRYAESRDYRFNELIDSLSNFKI